MLTLNNVEIELSFFNIVVTYFIIINLVAFFLFGIDKSRSQQTGARRIRERTLWLSMLFGGSLGALLAMYLFRHKTKKISFQAVAAIILALQIWLIYYFYQLSLLAQM